MRAMAMPMDERTRTWLHALPEVDPPAHLWRRIEHGQRVVRRRRALAQAAGGALMCATLVLAVAVLPRPQSVPTDLAGWQQQSRALERASTAQLHSQRGTLVIPAIDRRLQEAYERNADPAELEYLWQTRSQGLRHAASQTHPPPPLARI